MARVLFLALAPDLARTGRDMVVGFQEVEATTRGGAVFDGDASGFDGAEVEEELLAIVGERRLVAVDADPFDDEADGVEGERAGVRIEASHVEGGPAADAFCGDVKGEVEGEVFDEKGARAFEVTGGGGKREGAARFAGMGRSAAFVEAVVGGHDARLSY
jgi:hypothetical protein